MQTPKKFSSFSDQVSWISDEKGIKIKDREYAEEMLRQIGYFPLMGGYKHLFRISNTKKYKAGTSFEEIVSLYKFDAELRELFFKYLLQIERQMRSLMSYFFVADHQIAFVQLTFHFIQCDEWSSFCQCLYNDFIAFDLSGIEAM